MEPIDGVRRPSGGDQGAPSVPRTGLKRRGAGGGATTDAFTSGGSRAPGTPRLHRNSNGSATGFTELNGQSLSSSGRTPTNHDRFSSVSGRVFPGGVVRTPPDASRTPDQRLGDFINSRAAGIRFYGFGNSNGTSQY